MRSRFPRWYVGGSIGQSRYDLQGFPGDNKDTAFNINGGYWLSPNAALEVGYTDFGTSKVFDGELKIRNTYGALVLNAPVSDMFSVFGKVGYGSVHYSNSSPGSSTASGGTVITVNGVSISGNKGETIYGLGAGYSFTHNLTGTLEWQRVDKIKVDVGLIGLRYAF